MISHNWSPMKRLIWLRGSGITGGSATWSTISGNPVSFTAKAAPLRKLEVAFSPVQNLNGFDNPWPAGGGVNKWDGIWENGEINSSDGQDSNTDTTWRSKNYIPVSDSNTYVFVAQNVSENKQVRARFYASDKSYIGYVSASGYQVNLNTPFTPPTGAAYVRFAPRYADIPTHTVALNYPSSVTTYSPYSNICPISGWSSLTVEQRGVNMWDEEWEQGVYSTQGVPIANANAIRSKDYIPAMPSKTYYFKCVTDVYRVRAVIFDASKTAIGSKTIAPNSTFETPNNAAYIKICTLADTSPYYGGTYKNDISINYPATDHDYHAYNPSSRSISISLGQTVYSGWVDVISGVGEVTHGHLLLNGTESWGKTNAGPYYITIEGYSKANKIICLCDKFKPIPNVTAAAGLESDCVCTFYRQAEQNRFYIRYDATPTQSEWETWISQNPVEVVYELATPIPIQLTPQEVQSLAGDNTMWTDAASLEVTYRSN